MSWKDNVIKNFDDKAQFYDKESQVQRVVAETLIAELPKGREAEKIENILEIGCGTGYLTQLLFEKYENKNICVSDISPSMIVQAQMRGQEVAAARGHTTRWAVFDAEKPPVNMTGTYDLIVANMVFQWLEKSQKSIERLSQLLKPGGRIIYSTLGPESFDEWKSVLRELDIPIGILDFDVSSDVYKEEFLIKSYEDSYEFLHAIKDIGAGEAKKGYKPMTMARLREACDKFNKRYDTSITWHILYGSVQRKQQSIVDRLTKLRTKSANES
ncbi:MAG: methyltransferase [Alphaproteobacteria bacterium]|nr:methyltransferase [Alphaproteobacteria bacterium]